MEAGSGLDFSRRIPRDLQVRVVLFDREFIFRTAECYVEKYSYSLGTYVHKINLISDTKDLTVKTLENMTLTQPKGDFGQYSHSVNQAEITISNTTTPYVLSYTNTVNSNTSYYDGMEILTLDTFKVSHILDIFYLPTITNLELTVNVKYNGVIISTNTIDIPASLTDIFTGKTKSETFTFNHTPSALGTYSVEIVRDVAIGTNVEITSSFSMTAQTVIGKPVRTYAQLVDKMLRNTEYVLNPNSRSRLNLTAPEGKYERYMVFDGLQKIGGELRALVKVEGTVLGRFWKLIATTTPDIDEGGSLYDYSPYDYDIGTVLKLGIKYYECSYNGETYKGVSFKFFDNPSVFDPIGELQRSEQAELEDYVSALELNTENVVKPLRYSPHKGGWKSLRSLTGIGQMTADNIGYELEDPIEKIISVKVRGLVSQNASGTETWSLNDVTDITERVLEEAQYNTLSSEANYDYVIGGKKTLIKNNCLYYRQGDNKIYGMSYYGETEGRIIGQAGVVRALYETVLAVRSLEIDELVTRTGTQSQDDIDSALDLNFELQITYANLTNSRARVYKDDQSGFERERIKYMNESANVNETDSIGSYAQQLVNRLGGTKLSISGVADDWSEIAELGDMDSQGRVYTMITVRPSVKIEYDYLLVQDYNIISSYIGVNSRHRVEEISSGSTTKRTLRYVSKLIFTDTPQTFSTRLIDYTKLLDTLGGTSANGLNYGYLECNLSNGEQKKIHLSLDSDSKGKTIEIKWNMRNNFSAGLKRYVYNDGSNNIIMNSDVPYTDYYGKVNDIYFTIYFDSANTYDLSAYPEASSDDGDGLFTVITDTIDKDAGEILQGLIEIPILSEHENIRVYDGFAKWNRVVEGTERIRAGLLTYTPIKNATRVNLNLIRDVTPTVTVNANNVQVSYTATGAHKGIVFYNQDTLEMLLAYVDDLNGSQVLTLPYYIEDGLAGGGQNFVTFVEKSISYSSDMTFQSTMNYQLVGLVNVEGTLTIGQDEYEETELITNYSGTTSYQSSNYDFTGSVEVEGTANTGQDEYEITTVQYDVQGIMTFQTSNKSYTGLLEVNTVVNTIDYQWVAGGTSPTANQTCEMSYDEGNVRCATQTPSECSWDTVGGQYVSGSDLSDNVSGSCFIVPSTKTECAFLAGQWYCQDYEAVITNYDYSDCEICGAYEVTND
jgi:hypothetical protein